VVLGLSERLARHKAWVGIGAPSSAAEDAAQIYEKNITTLREQFFAEVRPQKTGAAGDHYFFQASLH